MRLRIGRAPVNDLPRQGAAKRFSTSSPGWPTFRPPVRKTASEFSQKTSSSAVGEWSWAKTTPPADLRSSKHGKTRGRATRAALFTRPTVAPRRRTTCARDDRRSRTRRSPRRPRPNSIVHKASSHNQRVQRRAWDSRRPPKISCAAASASIPARRRPVRGQPARWPAKAAPLVTFTGHQSGEPDSDTLSRVSIDFPYAIAQRTSPAASQHRVPPSSGLRTNGACDTNITIMAGAGIRIRFTGNLSFDRTRTWHGPIKVNTVPTISGSYKRMKTKLTFKFDGSGTDRSSRQISFFRGPATGSGNSVAITAQRRPPATGSRLRIAMSSSQIKNDHWTTSQFPEGQHFGSKWPP